MFSTVVFDRLLLYEQKDHGFDLEQLREAYCIGNEELMFDGCHSKAKTKILSCICVWCRTNGLTVDQ